MTMIDSQIEIAAVSNEIVIRQGSVETFRVPSENLGSLAILGTDTNQIVDIDLLGLDVATNGLQIDGGGGANTLLVSGDGERVDLTAMATGFSRFGRLDLSNPDANPLVIDVSAVARMSPSSGLLEIVAAGEDPIRVSDAADWRMGEPITDNGTFILTAGHTGTGGESIRGHLPSGWRNFLRPADINNDGRVSAGDALDVINELSRRAFSNPDSERLDDPLTVAVWPNRYFDHNGDNSVTALDALRVINDLARALSNAGSGEGEMPPLAGTLPSPNETDASDVKAQLRRADTPQEPKVEQPKVEAPGLPVARFEFDAGRSLFGSHQSKSSRPSGQSTLQASVAARADYAAAVDELLSDEIELGLIASSMNSPD